MASGLSIWAPSIRAPCRAHAVSARLLEQPGRYRMARLRRVHEHVLEHCFTRFADRGLLREGIEPAFASRVLLDHILGYAVRERTVRALQSVPHDDTPM